MLSRSWVSQVLSTTTGVQDKRIWARNPNGKFSVKSVYVIAKEIEQRTGNDARGWTSGGGGEEGTSDFGGDKWKMFGLFVVICWNLWKARNDWVFKQVRVEEAKVIADALKEFDEVYQANLKVTSGPTSQIMANPTGWVPPEMGVLKINIDGAYIASTGKARGGCGKRFLWQVAVSGSYSYFECYFSGIGRGFRFPFCDLDSYQVWDRVAHDATKYALSVKPPETWGKEIFPPGFHGMLLLNFPICSN
ncbi:hypothetical protein RHMOL_Rhmol06G0214100 [Rhododendron molle]|uniref:Uncharacterized protein n=1 Tax=Rhododendron molle TaxID=49168 RepID=A0ACC0NEU1_RHOML|nr:hypothetical protein RHMOL_Rhmol06G0214100 [Rhododendron molle]